jgi:4-alpha-glucanotransferase
MVKYSTQESGILLHVTSLPGDYGIGEIGKEAEQFVDCLKKMGQSLWQILPLGYPGNTQSPYDLLSSFAGNPLLISLDMLVKDGYLKQDNLLVKSGQKNHQIDFDSLIHHKMEILNSAAETFFNHASEEIKILYQDFCKENDYWLDEYSLFLTLKEIHNGKSWNHWSDPLRKRENTALKKINDEYFSEIEKTKIIQFLFHCQWAKLKRYANESGVRIIGDLPLYVTHDSAEVWANPELFSLNNNGDMTFVSGVPPCFFSKTGQLWGHPLYQWKAHETSHYKWWKSRFNKLYKMVDIIRIDHFNGIAKYWKVPAGSSTAMNGEWVEGPGENLFEEIFNCVGENAIIAEDLGEAEQEAAELKNKYGIPGMKILQFAFGNGHKSYPHNYPENCVVYTGTHDNDTTVGWFHSQPGEGNTQTKNKIKAERRNVLKYLKTDGKEIHWDMIKTALSSKANTVIIPLQDILGLDSSARMNVPGTVSGNWRWRFDWIMLTEEKMHRMKKLTTKFNRNHI